MDDIASTFKVAEHAAIEMAENLESNDHSLTIPAANNVRAHCKSFSQKADHFAISLKKIVDLFYPQMRGRNWTDFPELIEAEYGKSDNFSKVLEVATPALVLIRNMRDCLEHNLTGITTWDFELQPDGSIAPPTIEINFRQSVQSRCSISKLMEDITQAMPIYFEMFVAHMCSKSIQPFAGMPLTVGMLSDDLQKAWRVRFAYGAYYQDDNFVPCG